MMNAATMSTFSKEQAEELVQKHDFVIEKELDVKIDRLDSIINKYNNGIFPDFMSLDAEGLDFMILKSIDYEKNFPKVICVETLEYSDNLTGNKEIEIIDFLTAEGYELFADTYVNSIFYKF